MLYEPKSGNISRIHSLAHLYERDLSELDNSDKVILDQTLGYYTQCIKKSDRAQAFLLSRGIYDEKAISTFHLGFSDRTLGLSLREMEFLEAEHSRGVLQRLGLFKPSGHEFFRGSLIFPFTDEESNVTGGYGRRITPKLPSGMVYHVHWNNEQALFFNQPTMLDEKTLILCKNPIEALSWWCHGFKNVVSLMGAHSFSQAHILKLKQHSIREIILAFGSSQEELEAARMIAAELCYAGVFHQIVLHPDGLDSNELIQLADDPKSALQECLDNPLIFTGLKSKSTQV